MNTDSPRPEKLCFVTIGATAGFDALIAAALSPPFLQALTRAGYTNLLLQYGSGTGASIFNAFLAKHGDTETDRINVDGFGFKATGLAADMKAAVGGHGKVEGVVISHAGSGSILEALRIGAPLIVIPNPSLLDNHQLELADELAKQGYVVHGRLDNLPYAIQEAESLRGKKQSWPPTNSGEDQTGRGLAGVMDDEMGFLD